MFAACGPRRLLRREASESAFRAQRAAQAHVLLIALQTDAARDYDRLSQSGITSVTLPCSDVGNGEASTDRAPRENQADFQSVVGMTGFEPATP